MAYVLAAALVIWAGTFIYMIVLVARERRLRLQIEELRKMVKRWSNNV